MITECGFPHYMQKRKRSSWFGKLWAIVGLLMLIGMLSYFGIHGILDREMPIGSRGGRPHTFHGSAAVVGGGSFICCASALALLLLFGRRGKKRKGWVVPVAWVLSLAFLGLFIWACVID